MIPSRASGCASPLRGAAANHYSRLDAPAVIVTAMLILGGAAVVTALSGMNIYAASFLIPISAVPFTMHGQPPPLHTGLLAAFFPAIWVKQAVIH